MAVIIHKKNLVNSEKHYSVIQKNDLTGEKKELVNEIESENHTFINADLISEVNVLVGATINTGDFSSLRIQVGIKRPCVTDPKSEDDAYHYCKEWTEHKLEDLHGTYIET